MMLLLLITKLCSCHSAESRYAWMSRIQDLRIRSLIENALGSTGRALLTKAAPELVFLDDTTAADDSAEAWYMRVITEPDASAYLGPFVIDLTHPLTEGLSLGGVVWGAGVKEPAYRHTDHYRRKCAPVD